MTPLGSQVMDLALRKEPAPMSDRILGKLPLAPMSDRAQEEREKSLLNEMLDQIQKHAVSDDQPSVYDRIWESPRKVGFFDPPTTHLVANIEDLTEVLQNCSDEVDDMDEEVGESSGSPPAATTPMGKWTATSTYDIYMVDTPHSSGGGNPNNGRGDNNSGDNNNNDPNANPDNNANKLDSSLNPEDHDILNESLNSPNHGELDGNHCMKIKKIPTKHPRSNLGDA
jgi:hypothetical protein